MSSGEAQKLLYWTMYFWKYVERWSTILFHCFFPPIQSLYTKFPYLIKTSWPSKIDLFGFGHGDTLGFSHFRSWRDSCWLKSQLSLADPLLDSAFVLCQYPLAHTDDITLSHTQASHTWLRHNNDAADDNTLLICSHGDMKHYLALCVNN